MKKINYNNIANEQQIKRVVDSLQIGGIGVKVVESVDKIKKDILDQIEIGKSVFTISSETLRLSGIADSINNSKKYISIRNQLNESKDADHKRQIGAAPDYAIGSVQALTEDGHLWIASATGSQIASCVYGAKKVIYVIGAQKIVPNDEAALKRIYDYTLPLESKRTIKIYGTESRIDKLLVIKDDLPGRSFVYIVKESIGY